MRLQPVQSFPSIIRGLPLATSLARKFLFLFNEGGITWFHHDALCREL